MSVSSARRNDYAFLIEPFERNYPEFEPLYRAHHAEMNARLSADGCKTYPYNPNLAAYVGAANAGTFIHYTVRLDGVAVGYANVHMFRSMHDQTLMAREDLLYITPDHRNGVGKRLVKCVLTDLRQRGVTRVIVQAVTDLRVEKIWKRMGFKPLAQTMQYEF